MLQEKEKQGVPCSLLPFTRKELLLHRGVCDPKLGETQKLLPSLDTRGQHFLAAHAGL